ncbi:MAG: hypothetical protein QHJ81_00015 [Anaerolineae bacterium]|nr:hypothetical protein [Anaerolineae bacterium]
MTKSPVDWAADVLGSGEDILVPVKQLWLDMQRQRIGTGLSVEAFTALLEADGRFEFFEGVDHGEGDEEERALMEELGFYSGPRVKLADRELTAEYVARMLRQSTQNMLEALEGAWEVRPTDDPEAEQQLLEILTLAQQLKHEVDTALEEAGLEGEAHS